MCLCGCLQGLWPARRPGAPQFARGSSAEFLDAEEGDSGDDHRFEEMAERARVGLSSVTTRLGRRLSGLQAGFSSRSADGLRASSPAIFSEHEWFRNTLARFELLNDELPAGPDRPQVPCWSEGSGRGFELRSRHWPQAPPKAWTQGAMYRTISADVVKSQSSTISQVMGRLIQSSDIAGSSWEAGCLLPRLLCFVVQLPYGVSGSSEEDPGCSVVTVHQITEETLDALKQDPLPNHVKLFANFVRGGETNLPQHSRGKSHTSGVFKAIARVGNFEDLRLSMFMRPVASKYNGTPCLITKSGTVFKGPSDEWLEVDVDVRKFSAVARRSLYSLQGSLKQCSIHCGFTIQACTPEELPEYIVADSWLHNIDIIEGPRTIDDERPVF
ncbi:unnamed protein product [Prorocentrum cordatum]|uniref:Protein ENHANCED DISEASE RESISTANCE 2 C-terminal domain-containing protein n=1 Tax=Prorocentrum cordatum TaxID=2364126 RepID=A0ABN9QZ51_9DINO|nr:unnamed protein product [Polarella glacialis]